MKKQDGYKKSLSHFMKTEKYISPKAITKTLNNKKSNHLSNGKKLKVKHK